MTDRKRINVLIVVDTLLTGGAEIFALRLSKALSENCNVFLFCKHYSKVNFDLINLYFPSINLIRINGLFLKFLDKLDSVLFRFKIDISLFDLRIQHYIQKLIFKHSINVIHSNLATVDFIVSKAVRKVNLSTKRNIKHVLTIHGDYLHYTQKEASGECIYKLLNFDKKFKNLLLNYPKVICISDKQIEFFKNYGKKIEAKINLTKIYNGYQIEPMEQDHILSNKKMLRITSKDKVFGMVSRGIPEKGWEVAIKAFIRLSESYPYTHLVLVGGSSYLDELKTKYNRFKRIHFVGYSSNPIEWVSLFDVGLFFSSILSEGLPTVIIEYLACNVPVIASNVGEVNNMLIVNNHNLAGKVIDLNRLESENIASYMSCFIDDETYLNDTRKFANLAYRKFSMEKCIEKYLEIYKD